MYVTVASPYPPDRGATITHEGMLQVQRSKVDLFCPQKNFYMLENESIDEMFIRFTKITNGLSSLGDTIDND